jgi:predicted Zn-dependent peptidase
MEWWIVMRSRTPQSLTLRRFICFHARNQGGIMKRVIVVSLILALAAPALCALGFSAKARSFTLPNGLTFYVYERHEIPTFAGMIMVKAGSVDEGKGATGIAHFFEHLAFKGTPVIGTRDYAKEKPIIDQIDKLGEDMSAEYAKGTKADQARMTELRAELAKLQDEERPYIVKDELDKLYSENGGRNLNASTSNDITQYFLQLPANRLELWFLIESERFKYPALREFYSERNVIAEERRMGEENNAEGILDEQFMNIAFILHPYRHSVVGYMEDIQTLTRPKAMNFYKTYYIPNNMAAAVVGDVRFETVKKLAETYFGDIPRGAEPLRPEFIEPKQIGERRFTFDFDAEPNMMMGFHMPAYPDKDYLSLSLISTILTGGDSSRLTRDLVTNAKLAVEIYARHSDPGQRYASLFTLSGVPRHPHSAEEIEQAVWTHLERLKTEPVTKAELEKAINMKERSLYFGMDSNLYIAMRMLNGAVIYNDIDAQLKMVESLKTVTPAQIMETAKHIFSHENCTIAIQHKKSQGGAK